MEAPEELRDLARNWLREIAARELNEKRPRMDGGLVYPDEIEHIKRVFYILYLVDWIIRRH